MSASMRVYHALPPWLQSTLLSVYGLNLRRKRYGAVGRRTLASLRKSQWLSAAQVEEDQRRRLLDVLRRAREDVPFYRQRPFPKLTHGTLDELAALPFLTKAEVQTAGREMISDRFRSQRLSEIHTGGTTGTPLAIYCDSATLQRNYAFFSRFKEWAGIGPRARIATFAGRTLVPPTATKTFWRRNLAANTLLLSSYHIGLETIDSYLDALARFSPDLIDSYPSSVEPLARRIVERGNAPSVHPRAVITSSETLFPDVRTLLEKAFACRVFDHYGSAEMVALITQCDAGTYHVNPEFGIVEILDDGRPVGPGERGEIVATGFINPVMPMIRYATGDSAILGAGSCRCGRAGQTVERIEGRMDDVLVTPEGRLVGRLDPVFKAVSSLFETQIVQDAVDHVRVEIVATGDFTEAQGEELRAQLRARLGPTMRIELVRVPRIERSARGKLRTVINRIGSPQLRSAPPTSGVAPD